MRPKSPFLESIRQAMRLRGYSVRTEKSYLFWIYHFIRFHENRHPKNMATNEVCQFLDHLASDRNCTITTQKVASNALSYLYNTFLDRPLEEGARKPAKAIRKVPTVLTVTETSLIITQLKGTHKLIIELIYSSGLKVSECLRLRIQDLDFYRQTIKVRNTRGGKDRTTILSRRLNESLKTQMRHAMAVHKKDKLDNISPTLPAETTNISINALRSTGWMFLFPSPNLSNDPTSSQLRRHHLHTSVIRKVVKRATLAAGINKPVTCHTFRHSFAIHLLESGTEIETVQKLLGHRDIANTQIYTRIISSKRVGLISPFDRFVDT